MGFQQFELMTNGASTDGCIASTSRIPNSMEVFWINKDGSVHGAFWYDGGNWGNYELASAGSASTNGSITAVSRIPNSMEVFWIGQNGSIQDAYWYEGSNWRRFELAPAGSASTNGSITAVSRIPNSMEIFWVGQNGSIQDAYWYEGANWRRFELALAGIASTNGSITAVSRIPNSMEVFWVGQNGSIQDAYWYEGSNWGRYELYSSDNAKASTNGSITVVSRIPNSMEVFWVGQNGSVRDAYWYDAPKQSIKSPWAILLVKFKDDLTPLPNLNLYNDLFTSVGNGKMNMIDFFRDMSHGKLDINSSQLFGWYTLDQNRVDYIGNSGHVNGKINRYELFDVSKNKAIGAGVNLNNFAGVVVSVLGTADLFGFLGGMGAVCDSNSLQPSLLGQEMGHGYGLDHSRIQGSDVDYEDPWDIMSTANAYETPNVEFTNIGPGMNAWNMRSRGWLNESLVWKNSSINFNSTIKLRPLHRIDLAGSLSADVGEFLVEFRVKELWDSNIPRDCILVHRFKDNHSYLMPSISGSRDLIAGDKFISPDNKVEIDVISIDGANRTADLRLIKRSLIAKIELRTGFSDPNHFDPTPKYLDIRGFNFHINSRVKVDCNINFGVGSNGFYTVQGNSNQNGEIFINVPATSYDLAHFSRISVRVTDLTDNTFVDTKTER